jgi:hypothetical protein
MPSSIGVVVGGAESVGHDMARELLFSKRRAVTLLPLVAEFWSRR